MLFYAQKMPKNDLFAHASQPVLYHGPLGPCLAMTACMVKKRIPTYTAYTAVGHRGHRGRVLPARTTAMSSDDSSEEETAKQEVANKGRFWAGSSEVRPRPMACSSDEGVSTPPPKTQNKLKHAIARRSPPSPCPGGVAG
eukprot:COSAG01_NODE_4856_length_4679_cov_11.022489_3_plen_140_part_00